MTTIDHQQAPASWLGESALWRDLAHYYRQQGAAAWQGNVPWQATSNPRMAESYVDVWLAFVQDWIALHGRPAQAFPIVELGAGHGNFTLMMMRSLAARRDLLEALGIRFQYMMTDLAPANMAAWRQDPALQEYFQSGQLQCGVLDCLRMDAGDPALRPLQADGLPWLWLANYVFDSLPHEAFEVGPDQVTRARCRIDKPSDNPLDWRLASEFAAFDDADLPLAVRGLLAHYRRHGMQGCLLLPAGALACIGQIRDVCHDRFLLLCSDKGLSTTQSVSGQSAARLLQFVSASLEVNLQALQAYFQHEGGAGLLQSTQQDFLATAAFSMGLPSAPRWQHAFARQLDNAGPGDLYSLALPIIHQRFELPLGAMLSLLKLLDWDPAVFDSLYDAILTRLPQASPTEQADLLAALPRIAASRYSLSEAADTLFKIAHLLQTMGRLPSAIEMYLVRIEERGESAETSYNLGLCYIAQQQTEPAKAAFLRACALQPEMLPAQGWLYRLG